MAIHDEVLRTAQRLCAARADATFSPDDLVRALPHLNANSVRTHVTSRCCVDAAPHHQSRLAYFRKLGRGRYELLPQHRQRPPRRRASMTAARPDVAGRDVIHAVVTRADDTYVVECLEIAVVTQGRTLDEALANLRDAVALHLEGEDPATFGLTTLRRIHVSYDLPATDAA
jgi:hypothetical protein